MRSAKNVMFLRCNGIAGAMKPDRIKLYRTSILYTEYNLIYNSLSGDELPDLPLYSNGLYI